MFSRVGAAAYKKDLTNTIAMCDAIGNPQQSFKSIHIAGTNGKGSTSNMLAAILQSSGYKTGLYTSPHLKDFRERIRINGAMCNKDFIVHFVQQIKPLIETIQPSFFEVTVAMAFAYFAQNKVDVAVIETGLGGRLDSTNIIQPILSIITNIGYDHMNILGSTLPEIAFEKAGIIKPNTPVVIGEYNNETKQVFIDKAQACNSAIHFVQDEFAVTSHQLKNALLEVSLTDEQTQIHSTYLLDLTANYQIKNCTTVIAACKQLNQLGIQLNHQNILHGLAHTQSLTKFAGRWQVLQHKPIVIADVAHNADGVKQVLQNLQSINYNNLHILIGMVKDKDINAVLALLPTQAMYYFTQAQIERALNKEELQQQAATYNLHGLTYSNVNTAIEAAKQNANKQDLILIIGSVFLIGEIENIC